MSDVILIGLIIAALAALLLYRLGFLKKREPKTGWSIGPIFEGRNYSTGMPARPTPLAGGVWTVTINPGAELDGITMPRGPISGAIKLRYRVTGTGLAPFVKPNEQPDGPAMLTLYMEKAGDNGYIETNRWYTIVPLSLEPGEYDLTVPFALDVWDDMGGAWASSLPDQFAATLADSGRIGMGFGWRGGRMHGVKTESAVTFDLLEWSVG